MKRHETPLLKLLLERATVVVGAAAFTLAFFLVLPLLQALTAPPKHDTMVQGIDTVAEPPPPPPPVEEEPEEEPEPEEPPPELTEDTQPLDLAQLELALNPGFGDGWGSADFEVKLGDAAEGGGGLNELFDLADLDQKPRIVYQPSPSVSDKLRKQAPATVYILFVVDERGKVDSPKVQKSTNPAFERAALNAVKQWKFEPGKRKGEAVSFRMRVPVTFPKG
ncbi:MAG: hypothetical protein DHS20C15_30480 [Planctomycetota bacterium]|nr:MAG: hypothetical protein DHS20C15_30480 [Planctomycetota bacterium]